MKIVISDGRQNVLIRGGERAYELCEPRTREGQDSWEPVRWYISLSSLFDELLRSRIRNSDARTLKELKVVIEAARKELMSVYQDAMGVT